MEKLKLRGNWVKEAIRSKKAKCDIITTDMEKEQKTWAKNCEGKQNIACQSALGGLWIAGWLFTIGFLHLAFWKGVLALPLWPYFLGVELTLIAGD
ncbi:MAG: hypothetical protein PHV43_02245 [Candidatus Colwellbacteria bacterium]|nr:hypothetical protein [Candidatus Colwellbacteria bacterium]